MLPVSQARHGIRISRVASQMEAADTLDGNDSAGIDKCGGGLDCIAVSSIGLARPSGILQPNLRAANRAGVRLGVEAAV